MPKANKRRTLCRTTPIHKGAAYGGVGTALDLVRQPRLFGRAVDLGCYEAQSGSGTMLWVR